MRIQLDTTSNVIRNPEIKKQIEDQLRNQFEKDLPEVTKRMSEIPALLTADVGFYSKLLDEAKNCYFSGLFHASVSMIGIAAERFVIELSEKMKFKINEEEITEEDLFRGPIQKQQWRLNLSNVNPFRKVNNISLGNQKFIHFWHMQPFHLRGYELNNLSFAYFISNLFKRNEIKTL